MVAEHLNEGLSEVIGCSLAKISMVAELVLGLFNTITGCSLAKISMVAEQLNQRVL